MNERSTPSTFRKNIISKIPLILQIPKKSATRNYHNCGNSKELDTLMICKITNRAIPKKYCDNCLYMRLN